MFLFHGTFDSSDKEDSRFSPAISIFRNGIFLSNGRRKQDFSDNDTRYREDVAEGGFYTLPELAGAIQWACGSRMGRPAVLVYALGMNTLSDELPGADCVDFWNSHDIPEGERFWQRVVRYYRNGRERHHVSEAEAERLAHCDYIVGPRTDGGSSSTISRAGGKWPTTTTTPTRTPRVSSGRTRITTSSGASSRSAPLEFSTSTYCSLFSSEHSSIIISPLSLISSYTRNYSFSLTHSFAHSHTC